MKCTNANCRPGRPRCKWCRTRRQKRSGKWTVCRCDNYHFPHRKGSGLCGNDAAMNLRAYGPPP